MTDYKLRKNVAVLVRRDSHFLLCRRIRPENAWQLVQGGVEEGETFQTAAERELVEELGLQSSASFEFVAKAPPQYYLFPEGVEWSIAQHYDGQEQTVCLFDFDGDDDAFDLSKDDPPEFNAFKWCSREDMIRGCWELKRPIVESAFLYFDKTAVW